MPIYNVTLKDGASDEDLQKAKQAVKDKGGEITHEYTLIRGFVAEFPEDHVDVLTTNDKITVEQDGEVKTQ